MRLDGFGLLVNDMGRMIRFYRDVLGFEIKENEDTENVYLVKDGTLFLLYGRKDFEKLTSHEYEYVKGLNGCASSIEFYVHGPLEPVEIVDGFTFEPGVLYARIVDGQNIRRNPYIEENDLIVESNSIV